MPLPYPHGSSAGQIAHNSFYDTGVTPGSTGGKFIGWGEEGTSGNANRAHWALSENIDYLYTKMSADKAIPKGQAVASGHGGIGKYHLSGDVFVGDASYPGSAGVGDPEGMLLLFAVMDENYDELTDGDGHEVIVNIVRDTTETTGVYKTSGGFATDPWIYFEANGSPYTIPDAQEIRILYGEKGNMENLPVDAFTRFKLNSAAEAQAGVVLQDGTRPMTGDFNLDGHKVINADEVLGETGSNDLLVRAYQHLRLQGDQKVYLKDQNLTGNGVELAQPGDYGIYDTGFGEHYSLVKSLNSKTHATEGLCYLGLAAGYLNTVSMPGTGGVISWANTGIMASGEHFLTPAGSLNVASPMQPSGWYYLATDGFSMYLRSSGSLQTGDVALYYFNWDGVNIVEYRKLARQYNGRADAMEITVGGRGADFSSSQLQEALNYAAHVGSVSSTADVPGSTVIKIKTGATWSTTLQIRCDIIIRGEGTGRTLLRSNCGTNNDAIKGNNFKVVMEDLTIQQDSDEMVGWVAMIRDFGEWSIFRNLRLTAGTSFNRGFSVAFLVDASGNADFSTFENIEAETITTGFIRSNESGLTSPKMDYAKIKNCSVSLRTASYGLWIAGSNNDVSGCKFLPQAGAPGYFNDHGIVIGPGGSVRDTYIYMNNPTGSGQGIRCRQEISQDSYTVIDHCRIDGCDAGVVIDQNTTAWRTAVNILNTSFNYVDEGCQLQPASVSPDSFVNVMGCTFSDVSVVGVRINNANLRVRISHCHFVDQLGMCVYSQAGPTQVSHCYFEGWGTGGPLNNCVDFNVLSGAHTVNGCVFGSGAPSGGSYISTAAPVSVYGNQISGPGGTNTNKGIQLVGGSDDSFVGHNIIADVNTGIRVEGTNLVFIFGAHNRIEGNRFWGIPENGYGILVDGAEFQLIIGNEFAGCTGVGIKIQHLSGGVLGDAKGNLIANNSFLNVQGKTSGTDRVIWVEEGANGSGRMTSILGNKLYTCGHTDVGSSYQYQINGDAADCLVANNYVAWLQGATSDVVAAINWSGPCSLVGNYVMHDMSNVFVSRPGAMYGVVCHAQESLVANNFIDFKNTSPDIYPTSVYAVYVSVSHVAIIGNCIRGWAQTGGTPNNESIFASNLQNGLLVGNWCEQHRIYYDGQFTPSVGNYGGLVSIVRNAVVNLYPENTAYNATAQSIFTDVNY